MSPDEVNKILTKFEALTAARTTGMIQHVLEQVGLMAKAHRASIDALITLAASALMLTRLYETNPELFDSLKDEAVDALRRCGLAFTSRNN